MIAGKTATDVKTKKQGRAIVKGGRGTGTRTFALLSSILSYAVARGIQARQPGHGAFRSLSRAPQGAPGREINIRRSAQALAAARHKARRGSPSKPARLLALSGCRLGEVVRLKRPECDVAGRLPSARRHKDRRERAPARKAALEFLKAS